MPLPGDPPVSLTDDERKIWDSAIDYYDRELASKDLLFDAEMRAINAALADAGESLWTPALKAAHRDVLESAASVYRKHWWPEHDRANRAWVADAVRHVMPVATMIIERLTRLYEVKWFTAPVRVDVVRVGKSQGAYTAMEPRVHIVLASADRDYDGWGATEMLFHESSHALIDNVRSAIDRAAKAARKDPRDLWHVVLFFVTGEVTRQTLAAQGVDYQPYLYATGLFDRAWPAFRAPVEANVRPFIDGRTTLEEMAAHLAGALP
jgi:hypothetical protein